MASAYNVTRIPAKLCIVGDGFQCAANCEQANLAKMEPGGTSVKFILAEGATPPSLEDHLPQYGLSDSNEDIVAQCGTPSTPDPLVPVTEGGDQKKAQRRRLPEPSSG